jgi:hypothetical protein
MAGEKNVLSHELLEKAFHGICFSANVACFSRTWVSRFINRLRKSFFIDPMSYTFQLSLDGISKGDTLKKSFSGLAEMYGEPISSAVSNKREIKPSNFNENNIASMLENLFDFQRNIAKPESSSQMSLMEFGEWLGEKTAEQEPEFLVVPYFWFDSLKSEWYDLNLRIMELGKEKCQDMPLYGVICTNKEIVFKEKWVTKIMSDFGMVDGILLWLSDFNEYEMSGRILKYYLNFVQKISRNKDIIVMYGSYFSMLASQFGLSGMSPGIGMSESKTVGKHPTGGTFSNKYYVPEARVMVTDADARSFYADNPDALCTCDICNGSKIRNSGDVHQFFDELTPLKAKIHYCLCKTLELEEITARDLNEMESILSSNIRFCSDRTASLYNIPFKHQARWLSAIQDLD